ncbi:MAG: primosomal protein N' [Balneolaceae bacterium]|nr:primosomal protein N' [Balneolaceae bacterium]
MPGYADIVFPTAVRRVFTYALAEDVLGREAIESLRPGMRVWVPLRRQMAIGMTVRVHDEQPDFDTRPVQKVLDGEPVLSEELLQLTEWIHRFYYCSWGEAVQAALPAGLNFYSSRQIRLHPGLEGEIPEAAGKTERNVLEEVGASGSYDWKEASRRWGADVLKRLVGRRWLEVWEEPRMQMSPSTRTLWEWSVEESPDRAGEIVKEHREAGRDYKWVRALELLLSEGLPEFQDDLYAHELLEHYTLKRIAEEGLISSREVEHADPGLRHTYDPSALKELNAEQRSACEAICEGIEEGRFASHLLYGVTGSGKTEVYIHALRKARAMGRGGLVLVPEIGLTPQIVERFYRIFGDDIVVIHSRLTDRERYDAWRALLNREKHIAIGARSAVFAPVPDLGLIVVDEEHDASYKQEDPSPRYHARDTAVMRAHLNDAVVVMGSATPSMSALHGSRRGKSTFLELSERPFQAAMPEVKVLDLRQYRAAMRGSLAVPLYEAVGEAVKRGEQAILLYNRRGYSNYLHCETCGEIPQCPNCSVSLNYHKAKKQLRCHYCGASARLPERCPRCEQPGGLSPRGGGTQQLEEELEGLYPEARVLRMDYDTTSGRRGHAEILSRFGRKEADILAGTQIVGKGLNFPDVTVVGVVDADTELAFPSFRSSERMFQLLSQVAGRSGRADKEGRVFFQTRQPEHPSLRAARDHDYKAFARREMAFRRELVYPPYSRIVRFVFKGSRQDRVREVAGRFTEALEEAVRRSEPVLGPTPAAVERMQKEYRWESMLKIHPRNGARAIERLLDEVFGLYGDRKPEGASSVRINVNVDALE